MTPRRKLPLISFPKCYLCGSYDVRQCPVCERFVCNDCANLIDVDNSICEHIRYQPPALSSWGK